MSRKGLPGESTIMVIVDPDLCVGCELCVEICPEVFEMDGDVAVAKADGASDDALDCFRQAAEDCPVAAITLGG